MQLPQAVPEEVDMGATVPEAMRCAPITEGTPFSHCPLLGITLNLTCVLGSRSDAVSACLLPQYMGSGGCRSDLKQHTSSCQAELGVAVVQSAGTERNTVSPKR
jgi:hypothetical protein